MIKNLLYRQYYKFSTKRRLTKLNIKFRQTLTFEERKFYLQMRCALQGDQIVVYDIGASIGIFSSLCAKLENVGFIHAFEPIPESFCVLTKRLGNYPNIVCHNLAVGDTNEPLEMNIVNSPYRRDSSSLLVMNARHKSEFKGDFNSHIEIVPIAKLDDLVQDNQLQYPDVIKVDVQGYENKVISGGQTVFKRASFVILEISTIPLYEDSPIFDDIYMSIKSLGFRLVSIGEGYFDANGILLQIDVIFQNINKIKS